MRKLTLLGTVVGLLALAAPAGANQANSGTDCNYAAGQPVSVPVVNSGGNQVYVYAGGTGTTGNPGTTTAGGCVNIPNGNFEGGTAEVGSGSQGVYAVLDGDDNNTVGPSKGYMGLSTYEDGSSRDPSCDGVDNGQAGSTNSGGCFGVKNTPVFVGGVPTMCGFTSGPNWNSTDRDGCYIP
jgi:hypothetical protein